MRAMHRAFFLAALLSALSTAQCGGLRRHTSASVAPATSRPAQEDEIREAVFRHQLKKYQADIYFLSVGRDRDPSDQFMRRFAREKRRVKKVSQCAYSASGVRDKATGRKGVILNVGKITWAGRTHVKVEGGYFAWGRAASSNLYRLAREGRRWVVKRDRIVAIA